MTQRECWKEQFEACCGPIGRQFVKPKPTGIEREFREAEEARELWEELEKRV